MDRYLIIEYCFEDDSWQGEKHILGSYSTLKDARIAAGKYITTYAAKMKKKYRHWQVDVQKDRLFFDIKGI